MSSNSPVVSALFRPAIKLLARGKVVPENPVSEFNLNLSQPIFYVLAGDSLSDLLALQQTCAKQGLPDPLSPIVHNGNTYPRYGYLINRRGETSASLIQNLQLALGLHQGDDSLDVQMLPVKVFWDRHPGRESIHDVAQRRSPKPPGFFKQSCLVLFKGRENLIRFSQAVSLRDMSQRQGVELKSAQKLARVARIHFSRMQSIAQGPRLPQRRHMFEQLLASPALRKAIQDEASVKNISNDKARETALGYLDEIATDFSYKQIRFADALLSWVWNKIYAGVQVNNAEPIRKLAQDGHEIVYVPCHRSHMDYLLMSYVLYHQGMVPPHIAAGVNLNFWPAGPFFRRTGAFFIRRSFKGNKLYSTVFREYLSQLFIKGYSIEYFSEGGRSRTGRLLPPKTGMLAMTLQAMLRGMERPVTLVPVYFGYEHVMEVGTYFEELRGKPKQKESLFSLFGMVRKLRNFGHGYVNFGEPIPLNQRLNQLAPQWRDSIDPIELSRPTWLTPAVNQIADEMMVKINSAAAVSSLALCASVLLASEKRKLSYSQMERQVDLCLSLLRKIPYSPYVTFPEGDSEAVLTHAISLDKFEVVEDSLGKMISLDERQQVLLNFYRNNIHHLLVIPAILACCLVRINKVRDAQLDNILKTLYPMIADELFMQYELDDLSTVCQQYLQLFADLQLISSEDGVHTLRSEHRGTLALLGRMADDTLNRYAVMAMAINTKTGSSRSDLEQHCLAANQRLAAMHQVDRPILYDKKTNSRLLAKMKEQGYDNEIANSAAPLFSVLEPLLEDGVFDTIEAL
ncbi:glycerol-3-phosphate 1-O-acyltransferase [Alginatibacterium sediminis]|uniref:Glycerol-3-phosphate acyltransferase n=1 Tax=Alginatibacterium sediminis TaxID=2164068 RepID=A0A420E5T8_9ALTE|nr:glycerol-3-phosphate 1-O-acyltransferase PlsB [Alginatibacterium sediminis]RKF13164.1 glycerol-3-phosphate 1-O-acyltransferase [Alginatibacterium sediminis]